jgi:SRSO17 transposase
MGASTEDGKKSKVFDPRAWGLPSTAIKRLGTRLYDFWERYAESFETQTRDTSHYALDYLSGLLRLTKERNFTKIAHTAGSSPQNVQHFMTNSPWEAQEVLAQMREEIRQTPQFASGGALLLDESAEEKASEKSAGAARQYNGRLGKIEMSQVGTFLAYANDGIWTWVDGELFLPKHWFSRGMAKERRRLAIPLGREFATKVELGWQMIERVANEGLPFDWVCCDTLYGRSYWLRRKMAGAGLVYMADVPADTLVYLEKPVLGLPAKEPEKGGRAFTRPRVLSADKPVEARLLAADAARVWRRVRVRATERGEIQDEFSARLIWTTYDGEQPVPEWLVMRREADGRKHYALSNAPAETSLERLAWGKCQRFFVEVTNREAKSEAGWDELRAQKYPAWEHQLALSCLASWFIAQTKLDWRNEHPRDPGLGQELGIDHLPALSMANVRELLRATMPLPQLTLEKATDLVVGHLVNRARSRKSRLKSLGYKHSLP